jgi:hypothetical protein
MTPDSRHSKLKIQQKLRKKHADTVESAKRQQITSSNDTKEIMAQRQKLRPFWRPMFIYSLKYKIN